MRRGSAYPFHLALAKHGLENFRWDIIGTSTDRRELSRMEAQAIRENHSLASEHGYNVFAESPPCVFPASVREKMSDAAKARWADPSRRKEIEQDLSAGRERNIETLRETGRRMASTVLQDKDVRARAKNTAQSDAFRGLISTSTRVRSARPFTVTDLHTGAHLRFDHQIDAAHLFQVSTQAIYNCLHKKSRTFGGRRYTVAYDPIL